MMKIGLSHGGPGGQCVDAFQARGQSIGGEQQGDRKQNTQYFHAVTLVYLEFCEIGCAPILLSVFG
jgi:hypothetical protein